MMSEGSFVTAFPKTAVCGRLLASETDPGNQRSLASCGLQQPGATGEPQQEEVSMVRRIGWFGAAILFFCVALATMAPWAVQAKIEIRSLRVSPNPQCFDSVNWFLVDFENGELDAIELTTKWQSRFEGLRQTERTIPVPKSLTGKTSGTLKISHVWQQRADAEDQRTIVVELRDKSRNKAFSGVAFLPTKGWEARSPIKLLGAVMEPARPGSDGLENDLRVSYEIHPSLRPERLYVEIDQGDGNRELEEVRLAPEDRSSGKVLWKLRAPKGPKGGEWNLRVWLVDESGNQSNPLSHKLRF
jgi:hypothetical protein